jgi:RNA polymerase primary sigma factor
VHVADQARKMLRSRRILAQKLNRDPTIEEIAADSDFTADRIRELLDLVDHPISLETPVGDGESVYGDLVEDTKGEGPAAATARRHRSVELSEAILRLNPRLQRVLTLRFGLDGRPPRTLEETGVDLGVTRERVRQLETRALQELRASAPDLRLYLDES